MLNLTPLSQGSLLDPDLINSVLIDNAMTIRWYKARRCSCWGNMEGVPVASGAPDPSCAICGGLGRTYNTYESLTGVVLDDMQQVAIWNEDSGVNYGGTIRMYVPYTLKELYLGGTLDDLILPEDITLTTRSIVTRGVDVLREHPSTPVSITFGATTYYENTDYRMDKKLITWVSSGPPIGAKYEATYGFHPWFSIVQGLAVANNFAHLNLPRTFVLQLNPEMGENFRG